MSWCSRTWPTRRAARWRRPPNHRAMTSITAPRIPAVKTGSLTARLEAAAIALPVHAQHGVLAKDVIEAVAATGTTSRASVAAAFYSHARRGGFTAVDGAFGETRYVATRYLAETGRHPKEFMAAAAPDARRTQDIEQVYAALCRAARETKTWVTSEQVRDALEAQGGTLHSTDINAVRVRLRSLATTRTRGAPALRAARVERAERLISPGRTAAFWWPIAIGTPAAPPGLATRSHGLRMAVGMAVGALGRPVHLRELKLWARAHPLIPEATVVLEAGALPLLHATIRYDEAQGDSAWGLHRVRPLDFAHDQAGTFVTCGRPNQADRAAVSFLLALDRYQPAIDYEQIVALRADTSLAAPVLAAWAEERAGAARFAFAAALGRCEAFVDVERDLRRMADLEIARLGHVQAWHGEVAAGDSDRYRDGRVITERLLHHAAMLPQLLDLPHVPWRGTLKGPKTGVPAESLRPLVEWVAEQLGDSAEGRIARWVDLAPRLTPGTSEGGRAGRRLAVDPIDAALVIGERLPASGFSAAIAGAYELVGPVVRERAHLRALHTNIASLDAQHARVSDSACAVIWLDTRHAGHDFVGRMLATWQREVSAA
jgi:hypothetical protein